MTNKQLSLLLKVISWGFYCVVEAIRRSALDRVDMSQLEYPDLGPWPELEEEPSLTPDDYIKQAKESMERDQEKFGRFLVWYTVSNSWQSVVAYQGLSESDTEWFIKKLRESGLHEQARAVEVEAGW